ncbi:hypothetical protein [Scytonema sp. NUACC26]|uniref:hypothetical protein n=1 Tax=Scytonema sp. NUACC26 TaxID=3140176 RepID=UPI0034DCABE4
MTQLELVSSRPLKGYDLMRLASLKRQTRNMAASHSATPESIDKPLSSVEAN